MKNLLTEELKRAASLLEKLDNHKNPISHGEEVELRQILKLIRKHSVQLDKEMTTPYWR